MKSILCLTLLAALCGIAQAQAQTQTVWRCGAEGRSYSDEPCAGGRAVQVADARTPEQVQAARAVAARDVQLARQMTQERLERERGWSHRQAAAGIGPLRESVRPPRDYPLVVALPPLQPQKPQKGPTTASARTSRAADRATLGVRG